MKRSLRYTSQALENLKDIADYIADESGSEDVAETFIMQLDQRCNRLASLAGILGTLRPELGADIRSSPHKGYVIFFRYRADILEILAILHGSRDVVRYFEEDEGS